MPVPDRLAELRRQRALVQEHLAWLDREIAAAEKGTSTPAAPAPHSPAQAITTRDLPEQAAAESTTAWAGEDTKTAADPSTAGADAIIDRYRAPSGQLEKDIRKGCLLYFVAAFLILGAVVAILWYAFRR